MRQSMIRILASAGLILLFQTACVDLPPDKTGQAILYVYDGTSQAVLSWDDVSAIFDRSSAGAASRTITSGKLGGLTLGGAGMALDSNGQRLYLVSSTGTVVRIDRISQQSGSVSSTDVISFTLDGAGTDVTSGVFGQAAVNPAGNTLYVTETSASGDKTQIWAVPVSVMGDGATITQSTATIFGNTSITGDKNGTGVSASSSAVYAYFESGSTINSGGISYDGPRLRMGSASGFQSASNVIAGNTSITLLGKYGCLAYDTGNDFLYVARHSTDSLLSGSPLLAFKPGRFNPGLEVAPDAHFNGPTNLRVIAHAGQKDWLVGALSAATSTLWIWKAPSLGDTSASVTLPDTGSGVVQIQGLALDGSN